MTKKGFDFIPWAAKVAYAFATSITCGLATPSTTDGVGIIATDSGIPARLATSTTATGPTLIPRGTKTVLTECFVAYSKSIWPQPSLP
ncbi:unannotated protein [freshwater metagenome]|uniref:Unannotated protein n=1 Tax=freshwater metagenome TaxID=449393 RepID=A0A6J7TR47_9ZZZZ